MKHSPSPFPLSADCVLGLVGFGFGLGKSKRKIPTMGKMS
jgi:hypothetical protein